MRRMIFAAALAISNLAATAVAWPGQDAELRKIARGLSQSVVLRADFHQEKIIKVLNRPLLSRGRMIFRSGHGIFWEVSEPYAARILLKPDRIVEWQAKGTPKRSGFEAVPVLGALSRVILLAMAGNFDGLDSEFDVTKNATEVGWWLTLSPKDAALAAAISKVEIRGNRFVESVSISEARGDRTDIRFSGFRTEPTDLDDREKAYFAH